MKPSFDTSCVIIMINWTDDDDGLIQLVWNRFHQLIPSRQIYSFFTIAMLFPVFVSQIYLFGSEAKFNREIQMNSSLDGVYIHNMVKDMTYQIQMSALTRMGEGARSEAVYVGMLFGKYLIIRLMASFCLKFINFMSHPEISHHTVT